MWYKFGMHFEFTIVFMLQQPFIAKAYYFMHKDDLNVLKQKGKKPEACNYVTSFLFQADDLSIEIFKYVCFD